MRALLAALLLLASPARAAAEWTIDPGTTGLLIEDHRVPVVSVTLAFPIGTLGPWGTRNHLEEAFWIQRYDPQGRLRERADLLAVDLSTSAGERWSSLSLSCHAEDLEKALGLVKEILANRSFDRKELGRWKTSRKLGWTASLKEPEFVLGRTGAQLLFAPGDPRLRDWEEPEPPITDTERLAATRDQAIRMPGRIVGFAGDLTPEQARAAARGLLPSPAASRPADADPVFPGLRPASERPREKAASLENLTQVYFGYGRDSLHWRHPDYPASTIADYVLGGHFNSRLMAALRQDGGDTYGAGVRNQGGLEPSAYGLGTFTRTDNAPAVAEKLRTVLATFHEGGITEEERAQAASSIVGRRAFSRQSPQQLLGRLIRERMSGLPDGFFDQQADRAAAVPLEDVNAFIRRFHDPALFTMVTVGPEK